MSRDEDGLFDYQRELLDHLFIWPDWNHQWTQCAVAFYLGEAMLGAAIVVGPIGRDLIGQIALLAAGIPIVWLALRAQKKILKQMENWTWISH